MRSLPVTSRGFTLVELLIAASVAAGILAGAYACLEAGLQSQRAIERRSDALQNARVALSLLAADLRAATVLDDDLEFVGMSRELNGREADNLDFATRRFSTRVPREADWREVSWYVDVHPETGEVGLWRRVDPFPDAQMLEGGQREEILPGLIELKLEFYDGIFWYDEWGKVSGRRDTPAPTSLWSNLSGIPDAVRVTLTCSTTSRLSRGSPQESEPAPDAPVQLQTVVRLNLAPRAFARSSGSSSGASSGSGASGASPEGSAR